MNYMPELNAFAERMRRNPLSNNAQLLWYKLMDTANRLRWPETFQLDNARIMQMMNVGSRHTAAAARQELVDDGLLEFVAGAKGKPSVYKMLSVAALEGAAEQPEEESQEAPDSFLWDVKDNITTYFGYTEALGQELQQITLTLWEEFFPRQQPNQNDERQVFHRIREQERNEDGGWTMSFPQEKSRFGSCLRHSPRARQAQLGLCQRHLPGLEPERVHDAGRDQRERIPARRSQEWTLGWRS